MRVFVLALVIAAAAAVRSNRDVQGQAVSLGDLLHAVDRARRMRIVILDSCRDNPFGDLIDTSAPSGGGRAGLAPPSPERGTLVAFAARDGQVALDGEGENSLFALALIDRLAQPGLEISLMFRPVRDRVLEAIANRQEPHTYGALSDEPFYLAGPGEADGRVRDEDHRIAWSSLRPEQELQLAALAAEGDTRSILGLAYKRLNPAEDRFDPAEAVQSLTRAAEAGAPEAQFELAKLYETGLGVAQDEARAGALPAGGGAGIRGCAEGPDLHAFPGRAGPAARCETRAGLFRARRRAAPSAGDVQLCRADR